MKFTDYLALIYLVGATLTLLYLSVVSWHQRNGNEWVFTIQTIATAVATVLTLKYLRIKA